MIRKSLAFLYFFLSIISFHSVTALAQTTTTNPTEQPGLGEKSNGGGEVGNITGDVSLFPYLLKVVFFLIIIGVLIYLLIRFLSQQSRQSSAGLPLRLLGGVALGQNRAVQIVQVGKKILILGVGQDVQVLSEIYDEEEVAEWMTQEQATPTIGGLLSKWKKREKHDSQPFDALFEEQLIQLKESRNRVQESLFRGEDGKEGKHYEG